MNKARHRLPAVLSAALLTASLAGPVAAGSQSDTGWMEDDQVTKVVEREAPAPARKPAASKSSSDQVLLKGGVTYCVPSGTPIKLKLASVPTFGMKMLNRDMDGKLHPAQLHQEITARTTEDIYVEDNKVIPSGTIFHGAVTHIFPPKRVGRPGSLVLSFDSFERPDGRKFAFRAEANNTIKSTAKTKAKGAGIIAAHAAGGAIVGALIAYQLFGMQETIAMHGYNIAGGAAAGALAGTAVALMRHGPEAVLEPGDDLNMEIDSDLLIPAATTPVAKAPPANVPGLDIHALASKVVSDGLDGHQLRLKLQIENQSNRRLKSIDLFIEDDNGCRFPVVADVVQERSDMLFDIDPYSSRLVNVEFGIEFPKLKRKLIWLDHNSRQPIFEMRLP